MTGFRVHPGGDAGGCASAFGADLATYGKVIGGGLLDRHSGPASARFHGRGSTAVCGGTHGDDSFPETGVTFYAGTFVRHPLALAAAHAVLNHLKENGPGLQRTLNEEDVEPGPDAQCLLRRGLGVPTRIEHFGSIFYFSFPSDQRFSSLLYYHLREKGVHIQEGFPCFLTTAHTDADIAHMIRAFKESIAEMQTGDALPAPPGHDGKLSTISHLDTPGSSAESITEALLTEARSRSGCPRDSATKRIVHTTNHSRFSCAACWIRLPWPTRSSRSSTGTTPSEALSTRSGIASAFWTAFHLPCRSSTSVLWPRMIGALGSRN